MNIMDKFKISSLLLGTFLMPVVSYGSAGFDEADAQFAGVIVSDEALFSAIRNGNFELVNYLVSHGANVNARTTNVRGHFTIEDTPLSTAIKEKNIPMVRLLLDLKADVNVHLKFMRTEPGQEWDYSYSSPLVRAIVGKNIDLVNLLIDRGADVNARLEYVEQGMESWILFTRYSCPLVDAIGEKNIALVRLLLERGANVNTEGGATLVPLIVAVDTGNFDIVSLLLEQRGIRVNASHDTNMSEDEYEGRGMREQPYDYQVSTTALGRARDNAQLIQLLKAHGVKQW
jgi:ankyrin repeat protein